MAFRRLYFFHISPIIWTVGMTMTPVTAAVGGVILATYLRLQYSHIVKYCLKEIKEGICCKFSNDWHREGDEFDRAECQPSSW